MSKLEGKIAEVTGASRGIGRPIARRLSRDGVLVRHSAESQSLPRELAVLERIEVFPGAPCVQIAGPIGGSYLNVNGLVS